MTTFFTRRTLLGVGATGVLAALTACASDIRPLSQGSGGSSGSASGVASSSVSASASPSPTDDHTPGSYVGPIKFNNYERSGTYIPASAEAPAQNVPKPVVPEKMNEATIEGMYQFLCYWVASFNYMFMTGDFEPLKKADPEGRYANDHANAVLIYSSGKGWVYDTDAPVTIQLLTDAHKKVEGGPNRYDWLGRIIYDPNAKAHVEGHDPVPLVDGSTKSEATNFPFDYKDGAWFLLSDEEADSPSSEASSASA